MTTSKTCNSLLIAILETHALRSKHSFVMQNVMKQPGEILCHTSILSCIMNPSYKQNVVAHGFDEQRLLTLFVHHTCGDGFLQEWFVKHDEYETQLCFIALKKLVIVLRHRVY